MFGLKTRSEAAAAIRLLAMKMRLANKQKCPCGCSRKVGKCEFNWTLRKSRRARESGVVSEKLCVSPDVLVFEWSGLAGVSWEVRYELVQLVQLRVARKTVSDARTAT